MAHRELDQINDRIQMRRRCGSVAPHTIIQRTGTPLVRQRLGVPSRSGHERGCHRPEFGDARRNRAVHSARTHRGPAEGSAACCLRTSVALAEGHQPLPELGDELDDDDGLVVELDPRSEPDGVTAHQRPPEALRSLPVTWPGDVSAA